MSPSVFTYHAHRLKLNKHGIGLTAAQFLAQLESEPEPYLLAKRDQAPAKSGIKLAPLIRHGFAALDRKAGHYHITEKGRQYLATLRREGML